MRTIDVKAPPAKTSAAETSSSEPSTSGSAQSATAESSSLLTGVVKALLHFISAHRIEGIRSVARNRYRFRGAVGGDPRNRHTGRNYVAHGATSGILPGSALKHGETLKGSSAGICLPLVIFAGGFLTGGFVCSGQ